MTLNPDRLPVPDHYSTDLFVVRRQAQTDNALDFEAVMGSRQELRDWSDSDWPEDAFTPEENAADLGMHIGEHARDEAYGFSIFDVTESTLLGSLYLSQIAPIVANYQVDPCVAAYLRRFDVCADYWLRQGVTKEMRYALLRTVLNWLNEAWWFRRVAFGSRRGMVAQRREYLEAGLTEVAVLTRQTDARQFHLHAR